MTMRPLVVEVAASGALHDSLRARELDVGINSFGQRKVCTADQQEAKFGLSDLLEKCGVLASCDRNLDAIV